MKIFLSAYACEPEKGSEPGIGWNVALELAKYHEVHVLTRANNRESIEAAVAGRRGPLPHFHYYDLPRWLTFWKKKRRGYHLYYYLWQYGAYFHYRRWLSRENFDVVQHLTFANWAMPSLFLREKGPLTVYGPIGEVHTPSVIRAGLSWGTRWKDRLRSWGMWLFTHGEPCRVMTPHWAGLLLESGHLGVPSGFPARFREKLLSHPQTGINPDEPEYGQCARRRSADGKVRLLICSEFLHWKGVTFACEIFGRIASRRQDVELHIYGKGPEEKAMRKILATHGVTQKAHWFGFVGKQEMLQALCDADILLYPSYHHGLATLILQAMWARLPIVAMLDDPVAQVVAQGAGVVGHGETMAALLEDLTRKTLELIQDSALRRRCGEAGKRLIREEYAWSASVGRLSALLEREVQRRRPGNSPSLPAPSRR